MHLLSATLNRHSSFILAEQVLTLDDPNAKSSQVLSKVVGSLIFTHILESVSLKQNCLEAFTAAQITELFLASEHKLTPSPSQILF